MKRIKIQDSTSILVIGYDDEKKILEITYKPEGTYHYYGVQPSMHKALMEASSKGEFVNKYIKPRYDFKKIQ